MEQTKEKLIFEQMPVPKAVFTLAVPTVISQLIVLIYNLADTWFIGQTGDTLQVAAVTVSYPIFMLLSAFFMLISVFQGIGSARQALVLSFFRKGILDLPLMILANLLWPMYGLMLVQPFMEFSGSMIALGMYRKQQRTHLITPGGMEPRAHRKAGVPHAPRTEMQVSHEHI